jgi:hypothetical protein
MNACSVLLEQRNFIVFMLIFACESGGAGMCPGSLLPARKRRVFVEKCDAARAVESTGTSMLFRIRFMHNAQLLKINI